MTNDHALNWPGAADSGQPLPKYADADVYPLIVRCRQGDDSAYATLYHHFSGMIYRLCYGILQHREDAEEVLQDSFAYAFRSLHQFDANKASFKTWLYQIAISRCRNKRRRKWLPTFSFSQLESGAGDIADADTPTPAEAALLSEQQAQVWQALGELSPKLRETAVLRYYDGLAYAEIGDILGIPPKTAESRMRLAHKQLRDKLADIINPASAAEKGG